MKDATLITEAELVADLDRVLSEVQQGCTYLITVDGEAVAILGPVAGQPLPS